MPQKPNVKIRDLRSRLAWIVANLDPNPVYRRYLRDIDDIYDALEDSFKKETFYLGERGAIPGRKMWTNVLNEKNGVSEVFLLWLKALYPDLSYLDIEIEDTNAFFEAGKEVEKGRNYWRPAIRYFAENRWHLEAISKQFYRSLDTSNEHDFEGTAFPLITSRNWIRGTPLKIDGSSEIGHLELPRPFHKFEQRKLTGLSGDYIAYKGALAFATRRPGRPEPQHNGEIFCADEIIQDAGGFIGFKYYLGGYFDYVNTSEILGAELAEWVLSNPNQPLTSPLPFRGSPSDAFDFRNRATYPGINCITIFKNYSVKGKKNDYFLLHKRDETQLQAQNTVHVVPAGGHQGFTKGATAEDTAIWRTVVREFCEELFNIEKLNDQPETWEEFTLLPQVKKIIKDIFKEPSPAADVYLHGFGLDPITLKPEVIVTIVVDWQVAFARTNLPLKFNWELQGEAKKSPTREQWVELSKQNLLYQARGNVQSIGDKVLKTLPAGAACMIQTAKHYKYLGL